MSTSYYGFIHNSGACGDKTQVATIGSTNSRREPVMLPSSFAMSPSSNNSSSLEHFNSLAPSHSTSICPKRIPLSTSSISPSSSSSSSSTSFSLANSSITATNLSMRLANSSISPRANQSNASFNDTLDSMNSIDAHHYHRDLMRQSSITPNRMHTNHSQLQHSYTLHSLEPKPLKPFKSRSAYLEAMKEDLAEWLNRLYSDLDLNTENFFSQLETGAIICRHANNVTQMGRDAMLEQTTNDSSNGSSLNELDSSNHQLSSPSPDYIDDDSFRRKNNNYAQHRQHSTSQLNSITCNRFSSSISNNNCSKQRPSLTGSLSSNGSFRVDRTINWFRVKLIPYKKDAKPGTFFARDNICQFILWCRSLDILECLLFETDDLVARKNEKSFILCLLEVARIGFKVGMPTPLIIQLEQEIDREIENDAKYLRQLEEEQLGIQETRSDDDHQGQLHPALEDGNNNVEAPNLAQVTKEESLSGETIENSVPSDRSPKEDEKEPKVTAQEAEEEKDEEVYSEQDVGPKPQVITNDLLSLHEKVVQLLCQCTCATQFPMVRIGDGKYKVGDKLIIFVRILRRHIMVRVGGGWQELSEFLNLKDPCRAKHHLMIPNQQSNVQTQHNGTSATKLTLASEGNHSGIAKLRSIGSSSQLNRGHYAFINQQQQQQSHQRQSYKYSGVPRLISGSASMSWLSHNS